MATSSVKAVLTGLGSPVEFDGQVLVVGTLQGCLESVVKQAVEPEQVRRIALQKHAQYFTAEDTSTGMLALASSAPSVERVRVLDAKRGICMPEVLFKHPTTGELVAADGEGTILDLATGVTLFHGNFRHGMRHGLGKAAIYAPEAFEPAMSPELVFVGEYDGVWANGLRHGLGTLVEDSGDRYEGHWFCDLKHGQGIESTMGGAVIKGSWCRGRLHGCATFAWPTASRLEYRHYHKGELLSSCAAGLETLPRSSSNLALPGMHPVPSSHSLAALGSVHPHGPCDEGFPGLPRQFSVELQAIGDGSAHGATTTTSLAPSAASIPTQAFAPSTSPTLPLHPTARLNASVLRFLKHSTVNDVSGGVSRSGEIVTVEVTDTMETCLAKMTAHSVLSVPVYDSASERFVAVVHLLDIFAFMLELVSKKKAPTISPTAGVGLRESLAHQRRFACAPMSEVLEMRSHLSPIEFKPLPEKAPLVYATQVLAEGAHAVPIMGTDGKIVRLLTQADIIRFLAAHLDELGVMATATVGELGLGGHPENLVTARFSDKAFDVFTAMRQKNAQAAPVVDNYGAMTANISFSDVKAIARKANFNALQLPVQQFFAAIEKGSEVMSPSIYVKANTMFSSLVLTLAATKIHQLYFVDDALHPVGTVRVVDLLRLLVKDDDA